MKTGFNKVWGVGGGWQRTSRVATCISWRLLSGIKGVRPTVEFGEKNEAMLELCTHPPLAGAAHSPQPPSPHGEAAACGTIWHRVVLALSSLAS